MQAMISDDDYVHKGIQKERRSSVNNRQGSMAGNHRGSIKALPNEVNQIADIYKEIVGTFEVLFERESKKQDAPKPGINPKGGSAAGRSVSSKGISKTNLIKNNLFSLEDMINLIENEPGISPANQVIRFYDREARVYLMQLL